MTDFAYSHDSMSQQSTTTFLDHICSILKEEDHTEDEIEEFREFLQFQKIRNMKKLAAKLYDASSASIFTSSSSIQDMVDSLLLSNQLDLLIEMDNPSHPFAATSKSIQAFKTRTTTPSTTLPSLYNTSTPMHQTQIKFEKLEFSTPQHSLFYSTPLETNKKGEEEIIPKKKKTPTKRKRSFKTFTPQTEDEEYELQEEEEKEAEDDDDYEYKDKPHKTAKPNLYSKAKEISTEKRQLYAHTTMTLLSHLFPLTLLLTRTKNRFDPSHTKTQAKIVAVKNEDESLRFYTEYPLHSGMYWPSIRDAYREAMTLITGKTSQLFRTWFKYFTAEGRTLHRNGSPFKLEANHTMFVDELIDSEVRSSYKIIDWKLLLSKEENTPLFEKLQRLEYYVQTEIENLGDALSQEDVERIKDFLDQNMGNEFEIIDAKELRTRPLSKTERSQFGWNSIKAEPQDDHPSDMASTSTTPVMSVASSSSSSSNSSNRRTNAPPMENMIDEAHGTLSPVEKAENAKRLVFSRAVTPMLQDKQLQLEKKKNLIATIVYLSHLLPILLFHCVEGDKYENAIESQLVSFSFDNRVTHQLLLFVECPVRSNVHWHTPSAASMEASSVYRGIDTAGKNVKMTSKVAFKIWNQNGRQSFKESGAELVIQNSHYMQFYDVLGSGVRCGANLFNWSLFITESENAVLYSTLKKIDEDWKKLDIKEPKQLREFLVNNMGTKMIAVKEEELRKVYMTLEERSKYQWRKDATNIQQTYPVASWKEEEEEEVDLNATSDTEE